MSFHKWIGEDSDHTGEYIQIEKLSAVLADWAKASRQTVHLLTNFWLGNEEIDAAIILPNSIILIELKTGSGKIKGSENGPWYFVENKQRVALNVGRKNPLNQCRRKRYAAMEYLERIKSKIFSPQKASQMSFEHTSSFLVFNGKVKWDKNQIHRKVTSWFDVISINDLPSKLDSIRNKKLSLSDIESMKIPALLNLEKVIDTPIITSSASTGSDIEIFVSGINGERTSFSKKIFNRPNYFEVMGKFLIVKISKSTRPFWGFRKKVIEYLNDEQKLSNYYLTLLVSNEKGWVFNKKDIMRFIANNEWRLAKDHNYKINYNTIQYSNNRFSSYKEFLNLINKI